MKKAIGVFAHVDAGKTTFSEHVLLHAGVLRSAGRVDHRDSFLDLHDIEKERGITVFSDQAVFDLDGDTYYWIDTPGHADLCAEMEHVIPVLDHAVLVISCSEGVESHTETVWNLLEKYNIPVFVFINKCDRADADPLQCLESIRSALSGDIVSFEGCTIEKLSESFAEAAAERDDSLMEAYLEGECENEDLLAALPSLIRERKIFPAFFGSALKDEGIGSFISVLPRLTAGAGTASDDAFSARAFKVRRDARGTRRLFVRITSGSLKVKDSVDTKDGPMQISELAVCHGGKYIPVSKASAGDIVCISGLPAVRIGDGIGTLSGTHIAMTSVPLIETTVTAGPDMPPVKLLEPLRILEDEDPSLCLRHRSNGDVCIRVMGTIETEILKRVAKDRFGIDLEFGTPQVLYMETVSEPGIGIGHYEPLRHYAEVWLRVSPAERGTGITFTSSAHVDDLALNWQRLIETHIFERTYPGVLIGAPLTDVHIELLAGRAHLKHTEGGDFREATCRALRCALMNAGNELLEPLISVRLRFPDDLYGRVIGDLHDMRAQTDPNEVRTENTITLSAVCTLRAFIDYPVRFRALTHGKGILSYSPCGYAPARDAQKIIEEAAYDPCSEDTPDSVFCSHGAGHIVRWQDVRANAHCVVENI